MQLKGTKVAILATNGFEEVELTKPRKALDQAGATTHIVSPESGNIKAWDKDDWGITVKVDRTLNEADAKDYDALLLPGGVFNPDKLRINEKALAFVRHFFETDKPVAVICHGSQTMIDAGVVKGRTLTSYKSIITDLKNAGANWQDGEAIVDNNLVSSRNPKDIPAFNEKMIEVFARTTVG